MTILVVFEEEKTVKYKSKLRSFAAFVVLILFCFTILSPLIVVLPTGDFMQSIGRRNEKPSIKFKYKMLCRLNIDSHGNYITWSTYQDHINSNANKLRYPSVLKAEDNDTDSNESPDQLDLTIVFPLLGNEEVQSIDFLLFFDYQLREIVKFKMEGMAYISQSSIIKGNDLKMIGWLNLIQNIPIHSDDKSFEDPILNETNPHPMAFDVAYIVNSYNTRLIRTELGVFYPVYSYNHSLEKSFSFQVTIKYPIHFNILYILSFWEALKWFCVEYIAIFVFFVWIFDQVKLYLFQNRVLVASSTSSE